MPYRPTIKAPTGPLESSRDQLEASYGTPESPTDELVDHIYLLDALTGPLKPLIDTQELTTDPLETDTGLFEACCEQVNALTDPLEAPTDLLKAPTDLVESFHDPLEAASELLEAPTDQLEDPID